MTGINTPAEVDARAEVDVLLPAGVDDSTRPSGGNRYDRRICDGLRALGWRVREHLIEGEWPHPDAAALAGMARALHSPGTPPAPILVDGMLASATADEIASASRRRPVVVLVHMPFGPLEPELEAGERRALVHASAVVATSNWTTDFLIDRYALAPGRVHTAPPGADRAPATRASEPGGRLLCVAAVTPAKGHDTLVAALERLSTAPGAPAEDWACTCAGSLRTAPGFARSLLDRVRRGGLRARLRYVGALDGSDLGAAYAHADLVVLPSRAETWGMVLTEALARGIPVVASEVGGVAEAVGAAPDGTVPGMLVPAGDDRALAEALRRWLADSPLRARLRAAALERRSLLPGWDKTARLVASALTAAAGRHGRASALREPVPHAALDASAAS